MQYSDHSVFVYMYKNPWNMFQGFYYIAKLSIRKPESSSVLLVSDIISTDEDPGLRYNTMIVLYCIIYIALYFTVL